jgi:DNA-binding SARP family transcriptional activator
VRVWFGILGPLEARVDGVAIELPAKARLVLATLLCQPGRVVSDDRLQAAAWRDAPPRSATQNLRTYVHLLRRAFGEDRIARGVNGYLLHVLDGELDVLEFERLAARATGAPTAEAARLLAGALACWRGPVLADLPFEDAFGEERDRLAERRVAVLEHRIDADLLLGRHTELVPELTVLVAEHPFREPLRAKLMQALYRSGRRAEALELYRRTRTLFVEELGLEPGASLRSLQAAILHGDPAIDRAEPPRVPAELPPDSGEFAGRQDEVAALVDLLTPRPGIVGLVGICGRGGVGKTRLAVHVAHRVRDEYPDGQLFLSLRSAQSGAVLARMLRALGVDGAAIPEDTQERAALFRSVLAGRRILIVLDDARDEAQVRPLVPGAAGCAVLVTSRRQLPGLDGLEQLELAVFPQDEAVELFGALAGRGNAADPAVVAEIVRLCGLLPLAVRIAAARLRARPQWTARRLADLLADERSRLSVLAAGDLEVRASLALSHQELNATARRAFRLLGALDEPAVPDWVIPTLLDLPRDAVERQVEELLDAQLLDAIAGQRYRMHDLTRLYAREQGPDPAAVERALRCWMLAAETAADSLAAHALVPFPNSAGGTDAGADAADGQGIDPVRWFEAEAGALVAGVGQAVREGWSEIAWRTAAACVGYLNLAGRIDDYEQTHRSALEICRKQGDTRGTAVMLRGLAALYLVGPRHQPDEAALLLAEGRELFRALDDREGEIDCLVGLGAHQRISGHMAEARRSLAGALELSAGLPRAVAKTWSELGLLAREEDDAQAAFKAFRQVLALADTSSRRALALMELGTTSLQFNDTEQALKYLAAALTEIKATSDSHNRTHIELALAEVYVSTGDPEARPLLARVLGQLDRSRHSRWCLARALEAQAELDTRAGEHGQACARLREAVEIYTITRRPYGQAAALRRLARAHRAAGDPDAAEQAAAQAARLRPGAVAT